MKKFLYFLKYWFPSIIFMALIFYLSSRQKVSISNQYWLNFVFFKTLHMIGYAFFQLLNFRATFSIKRYQSSRKILFLSVIISFLYAVSDEIHQTFVPTRSGTIRDVFIDTIGILIMYTYLKSNYEKNFWRILLS